MEALQYMNAKVSIQCVVAGISRIDSRARNWWNKSATSLWRCALSGQRLGLLHRERKRKSGDEFTAIRMLSWGATQSSIKRSLRFVVFARSLLDQLLRLAPTKHARCPFATTPMRGGQCSTRRAAADRAAGAQTQRSGASALLNFVLHPMKAFELP